MAACECNGNETATFNLASNIVLSEKSMLLNEGRAMTMPIVKVGSDLVYAMEVAKCVAVMVIVEPV